MAASPGSGPTSSTSSRQLRAEPLPGGAGRPNGRPLRWSTAAARAAAARRAGRTCSPTLLPRLAIALPRRAPLDPAAPVRRRGRRESGSRSASAAASIWPRRPPPIPRSASSAASCSSTASASLLADMPRRRGLRNVRIFADDARLLLRRPCPRPSLGRVFLLFPDPWPKPRHHKRRIVAPATLDRARALHRAGAELRLATDDPGYRRLDAGTWRGASAPSPGSRAGRAIGATARPTGRATRYEAKACAAGRPPVYLRFRRPARGGAARIHALRPRRISLYSRHNLTRPWSCGSGR